MCGPVGYCAVVSCMACPGLSPCFPVCCFLFSVIGCCTTIACPVWVTVRLFAVVLLVGHVLRMVNKVSVSDVSLADIEAQLAAAPSPSVLQVRAHALFQTQTDTRTYLCVCV